MGLPHNIVNFSKIILGQIGCTRNAVKSRLPKNEIPKKQIWDVSEFVFGKNIGAFGKNKAFLGNYNSKEKFSEEIEMHKKNYKGKCIKRKLSKCEDVCRTFSEIADVYAQKLEESPEIVEIRCNVFLDGFELGEYTSDFVCKRANGDLMVRECVMRHLLIKPMTMKLLNASRQFWLRRGVTDWGLVINEK